MGQVSLRGIRKSYGTVDVIKGVDLEVQDGEFMVFVGPSGCGKSTTLRMIAGLESITAGELWIDGDRANQMRPSDRGTAMVFQSYALYPHMTVAENMGFALRMAGVAKPERARQVGRAAEILRITELLARFPRELSGGQRQRVAIGRAIVRKPRVFLFDEPLSNLDASLRVDMRIELTRLHAELGATMIYVTHDQVEAMTMGDRIALFHQGRIAQLGAPLELYNRPATEFVASFLGAPRINLIDRPGAAAPAAHQALWQRLASAAGGSVQRLGVRPEHLQVLPSGEGVPATIVLAEHLGDCSILHVRVDGIGSLLNVKVASTGARGSSGEAIGLAVEGGAVLAFDAQQGRVA
ncbi:MAG: sn-glycerol-3-phosphate ABC transporter ATP-binding protein UgpC [Pseudomonadota bacterium]|nr:sn-glycerol-3-phosphate ABC transporter ATP-binding protein UgpC [Pseudomonadota bacterium]